MKRKVCFSRDIGINLQVHMSLTPRKTTIPSHPLELQVLSLLSSNIFEFDVSQKVFNPKFHMHLAYLPFARRSLLIHCLHSRRGANHRVLPELPIYRMLLFVSTLLLNTLKLCPFLKITVSVSQPEQHNFFCVFWTTTFQKVDLWLNVCD